MRRFIVKYFLIGKTDKNNLSERRFINMYKNKYPFIFVHGMMGWGEDQKTYDFMPYWGFVCGNYVKKLRKDGIEAYAPSVGPLSSAWDRACELYAQLVGGTVDYGAAHSKKCHHERFGRTYDKPLFEGWGKPIKDGVIKKIHILGHSFGGQTVRMLATLLEDGCEEERLASPGDVSPLFEGGHGDWLMSVTTLSSPHNGATDVHAAPGALSATVFVIFLATTVLANRGHGDVYDINMEQFGLMKDPFHFKPEKKSFLLTKKQWKAIYNIFRYKDTLGFAFRVDQAEQLNKTQHTTKDAYFFSIAGNGTRPMKNHPQFYVPAPIMGLPLCASAALMGFFPLKKIGGVQLDETWRESDGMVPIASARYPFGEPHVNYADADKITKGIWHVMPDIIADHLSATGGSTYYLRRKHKKEWLGYWKNHLKMLQSLED